MNSNEFEQLSWGQRLYLIDKFNLNLNVASSLFNSSPGVIVDMKAQAALGHIRVQPLDIEPYRKILESMDGKYPPLTKRKSTNESKLAKFFDEITADRKQVVPLLTKYGLKWNTVKQHNRFDCYPERGRIKCKRLKVNGDSDSPKEYFIWRETSASC